MDEYLINELIEQLKENLANVESARNQVEKTVQAYDTLSTDVNKYASELNLIAQNVKAMISQLKEIKEMFAKNVSTQIIDEIQVAITTIDNSINGVSSHISDLINDQTKQLIGNIKQRTDYIINTITTEINDVKINTASCINQIGQLAISLQSFKDSEKTHYEAITRQLKEQEILFDKVRKQNSISSIFIIILLVTIGSLIIFYHM